MNGNEGSNSLALYACLDHSLCDLIYIAIGKIMNNKICFCGRIVHCLYKLFTLGMSYLSPGLMGMSLHYRAPVTTPYLTARVLCSGINW